ncbi:TetR/AcrR family transcriptional regulator [Pseudonocardia sp. HH130630-07]|uniref:TetR/AcrR family transcriptional regulator n=1 Tax=Pseudonocardia sp. HH130630-07 TaxID=1690815 RepID=UPI001E40943D|nr:TetR family transcriptional regulator [Pseudonocardia sp. HH130630-07]
MRSTRSKIVEAAVEMVARDVTTSLSVRKVAEQAQVSVGSLRYHFPTQQSLHDEVMKRVYSTILSDDPIRDRSVPARDRLVSCLRQVLAPIGVGTQARAQWRKVFDAFMPSESSEQVDAAHAAVVSEGRRRVEYWLAVLTEEGELPDGDNPHHTRFLCTILNGLAVERALPAEDSLLEAETAALYTAVDCVLGTRAP